MKNLRNLLATITLMAVLMISATNANAGILMSDFADQGEKQCVENTNGGILVTFTGILVTFTGILVTLTDEPDADCGK